MPGPLSGRRILEIAGIGPAPFCTMLLADLGAEVLRLDRIPTEPGPRPPEREFPNRGRWSAALDLKAPSAAALVLDLCERADVLIEGFRPGVMERLGLGPEVVAARNPRLVYARMTGWGQDGPLSRTPGHDINHIALTGVLHAIGPGKHRAPVVPLNFVGDYAGAVYLAFGIVAALLHADKSGEGQVVDAAMVDSAASMMTFFCSLAASGVWRDERGSNFLDGSCPYYRVYETADGEFMAVGTVEAKFYDEFLRRLGLDGTALPAREDKAAWPFLRRRIAAVFLTRSQAEWTAVFAGAETCVTPVLSLSRAMQDPHLVGRGTFVDAFGWRQPAPAPRFSKTPGAISTPPPAPGEHTRAALQAWGIAPGEIDAWLRDGTLYAPPDADALEISSP